MAASGQNSNVFVAAIIEMVDGVTTPKVIFQHTNTVAIGIANPATNKSSYFITPPNGYSVALVLASLGVSDSSSYYATPIVKYNNGNANVYTPQGIGSGVAYTLSPVRLVVYCNANS